MPRIHLVTDSGSDLPEEVKREYNISVVPLSIQFGDDIYRDGVDMSVDEFYRRLVSGSVLPSTCQPSPSDFVDTYKSIAKPGDLVISAHLSSRMSGTYQSAVIASEMVKQDGIDVIVLDTKFASMGIGLVPLAAGEVLRSGGSKDQALAAAERVIDQMKVYFVVDTLEYLQKNGRIGRAQALMGTLLSIKPVLTLEDGVVTPFEKIRGKAKALKRIRDLAKQYAADYPGKSLRFGLTHADCLDEAEAFAATLRAEIPGDHEILIAPIGPTIGVHVGPGTMALVMVPK